MKVEFDGKEYNLDVDELDIVEATYIKVKTGLNLLPWQAALEECDPDALKGLYWLMMKQNGVACDFERVNFKVGAFIAAFQKAQEAEAQPETPTKRPPRDAS